MFISQQTRVLNFSLMIGFPLPYSDNNPITWGRALVWEVLKREGGEGGLKLVASTEKSVDTYGLCRKVAQSLEGVSVEVMQENSLHVLDCADAIIVQI